MLNCVYLAIEAYEREERYLQSIYVEREEGMISWHGCGVGQYTMILDTKLLTSKNDIKVTQQVNQKKKKKNACRQHTEPLFRVMQRLYGWTDRDLAFVQIQNIQPPWSSMLSIFYTYHVILSLLPPLIQLTIIYTETAFLTQRYTSLYYFFYIYT